MNREESKVTHIVKIPRETIDCAKCKHCGEQTCVPYGFSCQYEPIIPRSNVRISQKQINDINKIFKQFCPSSKRISYANATRQVPYQLGYRRIFSY